VKANFCKSYAGTKNTSARFATWFQWRLTFAQGKSYVGTKSTPVELRNLFSVKTTIAEGKGYVAAQISINNTIKLNTYVSPSATKKAAQVGCLFVL
jgi:hypothetical protein